MVDYTDVGRDTGTKPVKVLASHHEAFLHASRALGALEGRSGESGCHGKGRLLSTVGLGRRGRKT